MTSLVVLNILHKSLGNRFVRSCAGGLHNNGLGNFSCTIIRNSDNGTVRDIGVGQDMGFEFGRRNLQTLGMTY
jgi:hypothetical protein